MYDENYKSDTASAMELLQECRSMLDVLKNECIKLSKEKEKLIIENLNARAEIMKLHSEIEMLKENQWGTSFVDS